MEQSEYTGDPSTWTLIGGPEGGSIASLAITGSGEYTAFAATGVGIFYSSGEQADIGKNWKRLVDSPGKAISIAISPDYKNQHYVAAGSQTGVFISQDGGASWLVGRLPRTSSAVQVLVFSPDFAEDGIIFAGTEEDGVMISEDRGQTWKTRNFGFLDACIYALVVSPTFSGDGIAYAGTNSGLYFTYNQGLAWRELPFPSTAGPILCLGISPVFSTDGTVFAGTEEGGLFRTKNRGKVWQHLETPGTMINALSVSPQYEQNHTLQIVSENGIFESTDSGDRWQMLVEVDSVVCLGVVGKVALAGLVGSGMLRSSDLHQWEEVSGFYARELVGFKLSPSFEVDGFGLTFGMGEGIWRTRDGGKSWECLNPALPGTGITEVVFSQQFAHDHTLYAASTNGVLVSHDAGDQWDICYGEPVKQLAISPSGRTLLAGTSGQGVVFSWDSIHWTSLPGPWEMEGDIQAIQAGSDKHFFIASINLTTRNLEIGHGHPGQWNRVFNQPSRNELVFFWVPPSFMVDNLWYAATGSKIWRVGFRKDAEKGGIPIRGGPLAENEPAVLALSGAQMLNSQILLASAGSILYRSPNGIDWKPAYDFEDRRVIGIAPSPAFRENKAVYAMTLGGLVWQGIIE